jgi:glycyl-tRNA synthetase beta chain
MSEKTFLVEIGTEELPPKALRSLAESFAANVTAELDNAGLAHGKIEWFAAPRRLALKVANLAASQPDREVEKRGPAIAQAFDAEGKPSKAAEGWARGCGITVDQAERLTTDKGEWLLYRAHVKGERRSAAARYGGDVTGETADSKTDALGCATYTSCVRFTP